MAAMLVALYVYLPRQHQLNLTEAYTREATRTAELFAAGVSYALEQHRFELMQRTMQSAKSNDNILYIAVVEPTGEPLVSYNPHNLTLPGVDSGDGSCIRTTASALIAQEPISGTAAEEIGHLLLGYSLRALNRQVEEVRLVATLITIGSFLLGLFLINRVSRRITQSLRLLSQEMKATLKTGCYTSKVPVLAHDEIGHLAGMFNEMISELMHRQQRMNESQQRYRELYEEVKKLNQLKTMFVSDASHHLRTPLTIIRGEVEVSLGKGRSPGEYRDTLQIVEDEAKHLSKIVENLLTLAKADSGNLIVAENYVDFSQVCEQQLRHADLVAKDKRVTIEHEIAKECLVDGDPNRLAEVVFNLLENAIKYTPGGQGIKVHLEQVGLNIILQVVDSGPGLPEKEFERIFERFYRVQHTQAQQKGSGLGLAICKSIIDAHGGDIRVASVVGKGSTFEIRLQRASNHPDSTDEPISQNNSLVTLNRNIISE